MTDLHRILRVLFAPETFNLGETSRAIEVARYLERAGHEVRFMGYSRRFAGHVREAGFRIELLAPELSDQEANQLIAVDQGRSVRHPFTTKMVRERVASELALFDYWKPHCVVIGSTLSTFISARAASLPLIYIRPYAMSHTHLATMRTFPVTHGRSCLGQQINRLAGWFVRVLAPQIRWIPASFRRIAAENRVELPSQTIEAIDADLNLIASPFPLQGSSSKKSTEITVGPIYAQADDEVPASVVTLAKTHRPVVYVGLGSSANRQLALNILRQVAELDVEIVTSVGDYLEEADRTDLPGNVHVYDFLPAHRLATYIDASVIHGGEGTVQTACASGVPFAGIGMQTEQRFNIDECARYGNGIRFTSRDVKRQLLPTIVMRVLSDRNMRRAAEELQNRVQPVGAKNAAEEIASFVLSKQS